jgi:phage tail sheath protein FI
MRMLIKIKRDIRKASLAYLFELNDRITRESIKQMIDSYLNDIMLRRGLYDYVVMCDETNNTGTRIDRNELWVDIALKPARAVEFIHIPIRVVSTNADIG